MARSRESFQPLRNLGEVGKLGSGGRGLGAGVPARGWGSRPAGVARESAGVRIVREKWVVVAFLRMGSLGGTSGVGEGTGCWWDTGVTCVGQMAG